jgi:hypothetical protein
MKRHRPLLGAGLGLAALLTVSSSPAPDAETLLREGNEAFARQDYAGAAALYEQAWARTTDPALVAFNLAAAQYRLGQEPGPGSARALREAEQLYCCCLGADDPRRARALYGLGNCLLQQSPEQSGANLRAAVECYEQCLRVAGSDAAWAADARYNLQKARLLLAQFQPAVDGPQDDNPQGDDSEANPRPSEAPPKTGADVQPGQEGRPASEAGSPAHPDPGQTPAPTDRTPPPGAGNLAPVPDSAEPMPLSPRDAAEHLDQATRRILEESQAYRRGKTRPPAPGVRDW